MDKHSILDGYAFRLRGVSASDAALIVDIRLKDSKRNAFIHPISPDRRIQEQWLENYLLRDGDYYFVVENLASGLPEGLIGLYDFNVMQPGSAEWGRWVLYPSSLAAVESVFLVYTAAFEHLGRSLVYCRTIAENEATVSFHDSCGIPRHGIIENAFSVNGKMFNAVEHHVTPLLWAETVKPKLSRLAKRVADKL